MAATHVVCSLNGTTAEREARVVAALHELQDRVRGIADRLQISYKDEVGTTRMKVNLFVDAQFGPTGADPGGVRALYGTADVPSGSAGDARRSIWRRPRYAGDDDQSDLHSFSLVPHEATVLVEGEYSARWLLGAMAMVATTHCGHRKSERTGMVLGTDPTQLRLFWCGGRYLERLGLYVAALAMPPPYGGPTQHSTLHLMVMDDRLPQWRYGWAQSGASGSSAARDDVLAQRVPMGARCVPNPTRDGLWVALAEKAAAKMYGSYAALRSLSCASIGHGVRMLSALQLSTFHVDLAGAKPSASTAWRDDTWRLLRDHLDAGHLIGATIDAPPTGTALARAPCGLLYDHVYPLLSAGEGSAATLRGMATIAAGGDAASERRRIVASNQWGDGMWMEERRSEGMLSESSAESTRAAEFELTFGELLAHFSRLIVAVRTAAPSMDGWRDWVAQRCTIFDPADNENENENTAASFAFITLHRESRIVVRCDQVYSSEGERESESGSEAEEEVEEGGGATAVYLSSARLPTSLPFTLCPGKSALLSARLPAGDYIVEAARFWSDGERAVGDDCGALALEVACATPFDMISDPSLLPPAAFAAVRREQCIDKLRCRAVEMGIDLVAAQTRSDVAGADMAALLDSSAVDAAGSAHGETGGVLSVHEFLSQILSLGLEPLELSMDDLNDLAIVQEVVVQGDLDDSGEEPPPLTFSPLLRAAICRRQRGQPITPVSGAVLPSTTAVHGDTHYSYRIPHQQLQPGGARDGVNTAQWCVPAAIATGEFYGGLLVEAKQLKLQHARACPPPLATEPVHLFTGDAPERPWLGSGVNVEMEEIVLPKWHVLDLEAPIDLEAGPGEGDDDDSIVAASIDTTFSRFALASAEVDSRNLAWKLSVGSAEAIDAAQHSAAVVIARVMVAIGAPHCVCGGWVCEETETATTLLSLPPPTPATTATERRRTLLFSRLVNVPLDAGRSSAEAAAGRFRRSRHREHVDAAARPGADASYTKAHGLATLRKWCGRASADGRLVNADASTAGLISAMVDSGLEASDEDAAALLSVYGDNSGGVASEAALLRLLEPTPNSVRYVVDRLHGCAARHAAARAHGGFGAGYRWRPKRFAQWARKRRLSWCERTRITRAKPESRAENTEATDDPWLTDSWVAQLEELLPRNLRPASVCVDAMGVVFGRDASSMLDKQPELVRRLLAACNYSAMNLIDAIRCGVDFNPLFVAPPSLWMTSHQSWPIRSDSVLETIDAAAALWHRIGGVEGSSLSASSVLRELQRTWVSPGALSRITVAGGEIDIESQIAEDLVSSEEEEEEQPLESLMETASQRGGMGGRNSTSCEVCMRALLDQLGGSGTFGLEASNGIFTFRDVAKLSLADRLLRLRRRVLAFVWGGTDSSKLATMREEVAHDASLVDVELSSLSLHIRVRGRRGATEETVASSAAGHRPDELQFHLSQNDLAHLAANAPGVRYERGAVVTHLSPHLESVLIDLVQRLRIRPVSPLAKNSDGSSAPSARKYELILAAGRGKRLASLHRVCSSFMLAQSSTTALTPHKKKSRGSMKTTTTTTVSSSPSSSSKKKDKAAFFVVATEVELIFKLGVCRIDPVDGSDAALTRAGALRCVLRHLFRPRFGSTIHELAHLQLTIRVAVEVSDPPARFTLPWHDFRTLLHNALPLFIGMRIAESDWQRTEVVPCVLTEDADEGKESVSSFDAGCEWLEWADGNIAIPWWWRRERAVGGEEGACRLEVRVQRTQFAPLSARPHRIARWIEQRLLLRGAAAGRSVVSFDALAAAVGAAQLNFKGVAPSATLLERSSPSLRDDVVKEELLALLLRLGESPTTSRVATALHERPHMVLRWCGEEAAGGRRTAAVTADAKESSMLVGSIGLDKVLRLQRRGALEVQIPLRAEGYDDAGHLGWLRVEMSTVDITTSAFPLPPLPVEEVAAKVAEKVAEVATNEVVAPETMEDTIAAEVSSTASVRLPASKVDETPELPELAELPPSAETPAPQKVHRRSSSPLGSARAAQRLRRQSKARRGSIQHSHSHPAKKSSAASKTAAAARRATSPLLFAAGAASKMKGRRQRTSPSQATPPSDGGGGGGGGETQAAMLGTLQRMLEQVGLSFIC